MKPLNQTERNQRWVQFMALYGALLLFITLVSWLSFSLIPRLTSVQQHQTLQEMIAYKKQLVGTDKMLTAVEQGAPLTDDWLRRFYASTSSLDQSFPKPLFVATTKSYRQLAGEYENARREGDEGLQLLNSQKIQLEAKKAALLAALAAAGKEITAVASAPNPGAPKPASAAPAGPVINPGQFGPFKPLLISGTGEFGKTNPEINASVQFMIVRSRQVVLAVYFETGGADAGTLAKVTERKELYTAPPGFKIAGLSVPERTPWRINYVDKTQRPDQFDLADGLMSLSVNGNTPGLDVGATGGSSLAIQLKKPIKVELEKE